MSKNKKHLYEKTQSTPANGNASNTGDNGFTAKTAPAKDLFPTAEHVSKIMNAQQAALQAEAETGRLFMLLTNAAQAASQANQQHQAAHTEALLSLGIDPTGKAHGHWGWDPKKLAYVKQAG